MRYIFILLLLVSTAYGQFAPTSAKTKFVNGIAIGSRDTSQFTASDTIALTIARDSVMYYRYRGFWRPIATGGNLSAYKLISDTLFNNGYTTRARLKQGLDSLAATKVSSVGLTMPSAFNVANSPITSSGTIAVTAAGNASQYIRGDGVLANLPTSGEGGGASVSYYLNGSVNQGTIGGVTYYEMNKTPIIGAGTDFTRNSNGYIASFLTDANDPALLVIPAGNWNFETYFQASSGGGTPSFYIELYKYDGTTFTLIASNSGTPKTINDGVNVEAYFSALAVPQTTLTLTDRLAVRIYVTTAGRTITLHTENNTLCQVITTFTTGLTALNGLTAQVQYFATGTSGSDFNISSATATHTFNLPTASSTNRGALSSANWTTFNNKIGPSDTTSMLAPYLRSINAAGTYKAIADTFFNNGYTTRARTKQVIDSLGAAKQNVLSNPVIGTGTINTLPKFTAASTIGNSNITDNGLTVTSSVNAVIADVNQSLQLRIGVGSGGISPILRFQGRAVSGTTNRFADIQLDADNNQLSLIAPATATASLTNKLLNLTLGGHVLIGTQTTDATTLLQVNGSGRFASGLTAQRGRFTSLVVNKDSLPINTSQIWFTTADTTGVAGTNRVGRRSLANVLTASISFDTTTRTLTIPTLSGGSSSVVIPRGGASGASGITALSSSRIGNLVTVSGDNGSATTFSVRDSDSTATLSNLTAGNGLSGTAYNGSTPGTWTVDTTIISTKNNVDALLFGYAKLTGADFTGSISIGTNAVSDSSKVINQTIANNDGWSIFGTGEENKGEMVFKVGDDGLPYYLGGQRFRFSYSNISGGSSKEVLIVDYDTITTPNTIYAQKYSVIGGTSSQFQKGDGSLDNNTYLNTSDTATAFSNFARLSGANFTGGIGFAGNLTATAGNRTLTIDNITNFGQSLLLNSAGSMPLVLQTNGTTALTINSGQEVNTVSSITANSFMKSAGLIQQISLKTANYTLTTNDHTVIFDASGAARTATLPTGIEGQIFVIKAINSSVNFVTVAAASGQTIEGASTYLLNFGCNNDVSITIQFLSGNWNIISSHIPPCL